LERKKTAETYTCEDIGVQSALKDFGQRFLSLYTQDAYKQDHDLVYRATPIIWPRMYIGSEIRVVDFTRDVHVGFEITKFDEITKRNCIMIGAWIKQACYMISGLEGNITTQYKPGMGVDCRINFDVTKVMRAEGQ